MILKALLTFLALVLAGIALAQINRPHHNPQLGDIWTYFGPTLGGGWGIGAAIAQISGPHLNPLIGDVWTYFGPTLGSGWGTLPSVSPPIGNYLTGAGQVLTGGGQGLIP